MPVHLEFTLDGEKQLSRFFDLAADLVADFSGIFEGWADDFEETQRGVFAAEGAFEGRGKWAELSPRYREWKDLKHPGQPILVATGRMRAGLIDSSSPDHVREIRETEMAIGIRGPEYPIFHQRGTVKMPQRKVVELTEPQKMRWVQIARLLTWPRLQNLAREQRIETAYRERMAREP